jgi:hypothetical protein
MKMRKMRAGLASSEVVRAHAEAEAEAESAEEKGVDEAEVGANNKDAGKVAKSGDGEACIEGASASGSPWPVVAR